MNVSALWGAGVIVFVGFTILLMVTFPDDINETLDKWNHRSLKRRLGKEAALPKGFKWIVSGGVPELHMATIYGPDSQWEFMLSLNNHALDGERFSVKSGKLAWNDKMVKRAQLICQDIAETNGFNKVPSFPLNEGKWEVNHLLGATYAKVNGLRVRAGNVDDYRGTIAAMVLARHKLLHNKKVNDDLKSKEHVRREVLGDALIDNN